MNNPLNDLGESLAGAFHEQVARWSALESSFSGDSLNAFLELADDIQRLEEAWQSIFVLDQVFEAGFVPEDLFAISESASIPERAHLASHSVRLDNYPFPASHWHAGVRDQPADAPTKSERLPINDWTSSQLHSGTDGAKHQMFSYSVGEYTSLGFPENQIQPGVESSSPDFTGITGSELSMSDAVWSRMMLNPDDPTTPAPSPTEVTNADSFWRKPLQNLGDFATRITYPVTEQSENAKAPYPVRATTPGTGQLTADAAWMPQNEANYGTTAAGQEGPTFPDSFFKTPPISGKPETLSLTTLADYFQPENQALQPVTLQRTPSHDPDDLLEALTELILRDFRRYYP